MQKDVKTETVNVLCCCRTIIRLSDAMALLFLHFHCQLHMFTKTRQMSYAEKLIHVQKDQQGNRNYFIGHIS